MADGVWQAFPYDNQPYIYPDAALKLHWPRLHSGDCEPFPDDAHAQQAWRHFHAGEFERAVETGLAAGSASGINAANKAASIYAHYLERSEARRIAIYQAVAERCIELQRTDPGNVNGHSLHAYALGRYSQMVGIARAMAENMARKIKGSLDAAFSLQSRHAEVHVASGSYHCEVISKLGSFIGTIAYGASREKGFFHYRTALGLNPNSAIARIEYANGMLMLDGGSKRTEAAGLYAAAAASIPLDAMERLDVELARRKMPRATE